MILEKEQFDIESETERLVIRPLHHEDYEKWFEGFNNRESSKHRHDPGKRDMSECTPEWYSDLINKHQDLAVNDIAYVFAIFKKNDGAHVGMIDFSTYERDEFQWGRIGYTIHNQYWRMGYGKEAVREALNIAFRHLKYNRIEAHINLDNPASIHLAESVGMEYECTRKGFIFEFGEWTDNLIYYKNSQDNY